MLEAELGPGVAEALARTAALAREDADALDELAAAVGPHPSCPCAPSLALPAALRHRVLRALAARAGAPPR